MGELIELGEFLFRSTNRVHILQELAENGPLTVYELEDEIGCPRLTVTRNLEALEREGWIEETERNSRMYRITPTGAIVNNGCQQTIWSLSEAHRLRPFLKWVDKSILDRLGLDLQSFKQARITSIQSANPFSAIERYHEILNGADYLRQLVPPLITERCTDIIHSQVLNEGMKVEVVLESLTVDRIQEKFAEKWYDITQTGQIDVWVYDKKLPFMLAIVDNVAVLGATDDMGVPRAIMESRCEDLVQQVSRIFDEFQGKARKMVENA